MPLSRRLSLPSPPLRLFRPRTPAKRASRSDANVSKASEERIITRTSPVAADSEAVTLESAPAQDPPAETDAPPGIELMHVVSLDDGWGLKVDDLTEPAWVVSTKKKAERAARELARFHGAVLRIYTARGKLQREIAPA